MWSLSTSRASIFSMRLGSAVRTFANEISIAELDADTAVVEEDLQQREMEIERKRNKSRLNPQHYNFFHGKRPYDEPKHWIHYTTKYNRRLFGQLGLASNVDPSICWMDKNALQDVKEFEALKYNRSFEEIISSAKERKANEKKVIELREKTIAEKLAKLDQWEKEMESRNSKKLMEAKIAKDKKDRLVEEVRRHFGFKIDPRDDRFQEMLAQKEKAQRKAEKLVRRAEKEAQMIAKLQQTNSEIKSQ